MSDIAETAYECLSRGEPLVLAKIISQQGSTPRTAGTQMVVTGGGTHFGTIGGGVMEARVIEQCLGLLTGGGARFETFDLGQAEMASMDMICGGGLEILLDPLAPSPEHVALFDGWRQMRARGEEGGFLIAVERKQGRVEKIHHGLVHADGRVWGQLPLSKDAIAPLVQKGSSARVMTIVEVEGLYVIFEPICKPRIAFVVGAGHVAQPTAHLAHLAGFQVVVLDDRDAYANRQRFPDAQEVRVLPDLDDPFRGVRVDRDSFVVIVTRGHLYDKSVLAGALRTEAGYIGMIGSRRKRDAIYKRLRKEGFGEEDLKRVHSPIGLNIGAETPAEIAVSIVAEMIEVKNR